MGKKKSPLHNFYLSRQAVNIWLFVEANMTLLSVSTKSLGLTLFVTVLYKANIFNTGAII